MKCIRNRSSDWVIRVTDLTAYEYFFKKDPVAHIITDHEGKILEVNRDLYHCWYTHGSCFDD